VFVSQISARHVTLGLCSIFCAQWAAADPLPYAAHLRWIENHLTHAVESQIERPMQLSARMRDLGIPGVSVAVIHNGHLDWAHAWGVASVVTGAPVTINTRFQAGSISKTLAAMTAMRLVEAGKLSLHGDVEPQFHSWSLPRDGKFSKTPVTLAHLLSHTSGIAGFDSRGYAPGQNLPTLVQILNGEKPAYSPPIRVVAAPDQAWVYSNLGYVVVQKLIEDASGRPYADVANDTVLKPLEMTDSIVEQPISPSHAVNLATGHVNGVALHGNWRIYPETAVAGLWSTPSDIARMIIELQRGAKGEETSVLSSRSVREMLSPRLGGWGLGVGIVGGGPGRRFAHTGIAEGYEAIMYAYAERGEGLVIMTNGVGGQELINEIVRAVADDYDWPEMMTRRVTEVVPAPPVRPDVGGEYRNGAERVWVRVRRGNYEARTGGLEWSRAIAIGRDRFVTADGSLNFALKNSGAAMFLSLGSGQDAHDLPRVEILPMFRGDVFLRGTMNGWSTTQRFTPTPKGKLRAAISLPAGNYEFKIAGEDWSQLNLGGFAGRFLLRQGEPTPLVTDGANLWIILDKDAEIELELSIADVAHPKIALSNVHSLHRSPEF